MAYEILWDGDCVTTFWSGKPTYEENIEANGVIYGDKRFDKLSYEISVILDVDLSKFDFKKARIVAELDKQSAIWNKQVCAIHVTKNHDALELVKVYEEVMQGSGRTFETFDTLEEATAFVEMKRMSK